jgi:type VI protein secretion system component Hcp
MANAYYLKLGEGKGQVMGSSRDRYHIGWIKLLSFSQAEPLGTVTAAGPGKTTISEFRLIKFEDRSSPEMFRAVHEGRHFKSAAVEVAEARSGIPKLRASFTDVLLGSYGVNPNVGFSDPGRSETFGLNFAMMEWNYNPIPEETVGDMLQLAFKSLGLAPAH